MTRKRLFLIIEERNGTKVIEEKLKCSVSLQNQTAIRSCILTQPVLISTGVRLGRVVGEYEGHNIMAPTRGRKVSIVCYKH